MVSLLLLLIKEKEKVQLVLLTAAHAFVRIRKVENKWLLKSWFVQLSHLAGESEAWFSTAFGLLF